MSENAKGRVVLASLAILGGLGDVMPFGHLPRKYLDRTHCADCDAEIPPGKPGRRCEACRAKGVVK